MYSQAAVESQLPPYEHPPPWVPLKMRHNNPNYDNDLRHFLPRKFTLRRMQITDTLGFNVRGGEDNINGIFVSWVKPMSDPDRMGLKEGDQIIEVNGENFEQIEHSRAVNVLKSSLEVNMTVRYFPYGYGRIVGTPQ